MVYTHLYTVPLQRRLTRDWVLELDRQEYAMRRMLNYVFESVTNRIVSYLEAGPESNLCYWILRGKIGPDSSRCVAAMLDLRWNACWKVNMLLRQQFWRVHLGRPRDRQGHIASWSMALEEISAFLWLRSTIWQRSERAQHN